MEEKNQNRRDFLKTAGIFAGALAGISLFKSNIANAALTLQSKSTGDKYFRILDNGNAVFFPEENNRLEITDDGKIVITKRFTSSYTYKGQGGDLVPLPPGMLYPINQVWGYNYNFVKEVRINGAPISFSEFTAAQQDGPVLGAIGSLAYGGFAWGVNNLSGTVSNSDTVQATVEHKEILASVEGIRLGIQHSPSVGLAETYEFPERKAADDPAIFWTANRQISSGGPDDHMYWSWPNTSDYAVAIIRLTKYKQAAYRAVGPDGSIKMGRSWKPYRTVEATSYATGIDYNFISNQKRRCAKLAVFHKATGALSEASGEIMVRGKNNKAGVGGTGWLSTMRLKG